MDGQSTLAETKLRLADIEAEKDEMEMQLMNLQAKSSKVGYLPCVHVTPH